VPSQTPPQIATLTVRYLNSPLALEISRDFVKSVE
jgi:hypothetical protein